MCLQTLKKFGKVHILVNNAGINPAFGDILDVSEQIWDKLFEVSIFSFFSHFFQVNVKAGFLLTKLFVPHIEKAG